MRPGNWRNDDENNTALVNRRDREYCMNEGSGDLQDV